MAAQTNLSPSYDTLLIGGDLIDGAGRVACKAERGNGRPIRCNDGVE